VCLLRGAAKEEVSFLDRNAISHGSTWEASLETGLRTCRVFIPMYSTSYFQSEYCGKEFTAFRSRLHTYLREQEKPVADPLILPVLWSPEANVLPKLPASINGIQYTDDDIENGYPPEYKTEGVSQLVKRGAAPNGKLNDQYLRFIRRLAINIISAADQINLPSVPTLTPLAKVIGEFPDSSTSPDPTVEGPRYVQFIFVAGKQPELQRAARTDLKFYGKQGGSDWLPYLDTYKGNAAALAADVIDALPKGTYYEEVVTSEDIRKQVQLAASQDKIVVVMVDTWTLQLEEYHRLITPLDTYNSVNCITLIAWNDEDLEANINKGRLEATVNVAFTTKVIQQPSNFLCNSIKSYDTFKEELIKALTQAQSQMVDIAKIKKNMQFLKLVKASDDAVINPLR
jgi:FxsC-like protein